MGTDHEGKSRKELKYIIEENSAKYRWHVPILNKTGQPNYLVERLLDVEVGDERILEMKRQGARNYIEVRRVDEPSKPVSDDVEEEEVLDPDDLPQETKMSKEELSAIFDK